MARYLSVVENAYRATVEEQDDTAVWFTHAMKNGGADVALLLRGNAVNYVARGQDASGLRFGTKVVKVAPEIDKDVAALVEKKVPVYFVTEDAQERGIPADRLLPGVEGVSRSGLAKLFDSYERVFHW
jgi:intracellular sulfur oxidation DsrE/DsrF family protein